MPGLGVRDAIAAAEPASEVADAVPSEPTVDPFYEVTSIRLTGDLPAHEQTKLSAWLAQFERRPATAAKLLGILYLLAEQARQDGFWLAHFYYPRQAFGSGAIEIRALAGTIESIDIVNRAPVSDAVIHRYFAHATSSADAFERALALVSRLPGVKTVLPRFAAGQHAGGTRLEVVVEADRRATGALLSDNSGSRHAGGIRTGAVVGVNSPFGAGDRLQGVVYVTPRPLQPDAARGGNTLVGRVSYDLPIGDDAWRLGGAFSRVRYQLGGPYANLADGSATVSSLYLSYPMHLATTSALDLMAQLDHKRFEDTQFGLGHGRRDTVATLTFAGERAASVAARANLLRYSTSVGAGWLTHSGGGLFDDLDRLPSGRFATLRAQLSYTQSLLRGVASELSLSGQRASSPLDPAEKLTLAGPNGVRAYGASAASVDDGVLFSAALITALGGLSGWQASAFYEVGQGRVAKADSLAGNTLRMAGAGIGLKYLKDDLFALDMLVARPVGGATGAVGRRATTFWFNALLRL
jgi:hemolysin activation/secretion protein